MAGDRAHGDAHNPRRGEVDLMSWAEKFLDMGTEPPSPGPAPAIDSPAWPAWARATKVSVAWARKAMKREIARNLDALEALALVEANALEGDESPATASDHVRAIVHLLAVGFLTSPDEEPPSEAFYAQMAAFQKGRPR